MDNFMKKFNTSLLLTFINTGEQREPGTDTGRSGRSRDVRGTLDYVNSDKIGDYMHSNCDFWEELMRNIKNDKSENQEKSIHDPDDPFGKKFCKIYLKISNTDSCSDIFDGINLIPLFLLEILDLEKSGKNIFIAVLHHLIKKLKDYEEEDIKAKSLYFNYKGLFVLFQRIKLSEHNYLIESFNQFLDKMYNIKIELQRSIFILNLESLKVAKTESVYIKKSMLLIYYFLKFDIKLKMMDVIDFQLPDVNSFKNLNLESILKLRQEIFETKNKEGIFLTKIENNDILNRINRMIKLFLLSMDLNASEDEYMIFLIIMKYSYFFLKFLNKENSDNLIKIILRIINEYNLSCFNAFHSQYYLKLFSNALKVLFLYISINSYDYYEYFHNDIEDENIRNTNSFIVFQKVIRGLVKIIYYVGGDNQNNFLVNNLLVFYHDKFQKFSSEDLAIEDLKKKSDFSNLKNLYNTNYKFTRLLLEFIRLLSVKNSFYSGNIEITNNKGTFINHLNLKKNIFDDENLNNFKNIFSFTGNLNMEDYDNKRLNNFFNYKYFYFVSTIKVKGIFGTVLVVDNIYMPDEKNLDMKNIPKYDNLIHFSFLALLHLSQSHYRNLELQKDFEYFKSTIFKYIRFFVYDDYFNCFFLTNNSFCKFYTSLFQFYPNEVLDLIYYILSYLHNSDTKEIFRKYNKYVRLSQVNKLLEYILKYILNQRNNSNQSIFKSKDMLCKILKCHLFLAKTFNYYSKTFCLKFQLENLLKFKDLIFYNLKNNFSTEDILNPTKVI